MPLLQLKPGYSPFPCAVCGKEKTIEFLDGDTVDDNIPGAENVAGGLASSADGYCYYACLTFCVCSACDGQSYVVDLSMIDKPEISQEWADGYFMRNARHTENIEDFTVIYPEAASGFPAGLWRLERMETSAGRFDRHYLGPFAAKENLQGPNGVANCEGGEIWKDAAALVERVWPLIIAK